MVRNDPERADDVVSNLMISQAFTAEEFSEDLEASLSFKFTSELIGFEQVQKSECVSLLRDLELIFLFNEPIEELAGLLLAIFVLMSFDELSKDMYSKVLLLGCA